jgi:hypothetical protein
MKGRGIEHLWGEDICIQGFVRGKPEGKRPLEKPRRRWEDIKVHLKEM